MKKIRYIIISALSLILLLILAACNITNSYTISYHIDSGNTVSVNYDENYSLTETKANSDTSYTKENYTRGKWYLDSSYTTLVSFPYTVTKDASFYLKWTENVTYYNVNFYSDNELYKTVKVEKNGLVEEPTDPTKTGYTFEGWYIKGTDNLFDFTSNITNDLSLYAKWTEIIADKYYTVTVNNGTQTSTITVKDGETITLDTPTKNHYTFKGWYTDSAYTNEFNTATPITSNLTIYAKWEAEVLTLTYYVDTTVYDKENVNYNEKANGPENPTKSGSYFTGWYTEASLTNKFNFNTAITASLSLYAGFKTIDGSVEVTSYNGVNEGIYLILPYNDIDTSNYSVSYSLANSSNYTAVDSALIRKVDSTIRIDILGLTADTYDVKIDLAGKTTIIEDIEVYETDRSGYAHFNYTAGVGAYNDDGTLKDNTVIVYVTDATKNTVKATINGKSYTGLINILNAQAGASTPLNIRVLDTIKTTQFNSKTYSSSANSDAIVTEQANSLGGNYQGYTAEQIISNGWNSYSTDLANGITTLNGLNSKVSYKSGEFDTYWNMCDVKNASNITIEGVGENAGIFQWGFTWSGCNSIEVKNLTFSDYTEDACSFQGGDPITAYKNFWVHNCTFNRGKNNWDFSKEQDKHYGDGATDFKTIACVTSAYNRFNNCKKTGLVGGGDAQLTMCITFHHNYYNEVGSRLPLGRQANMHFYNNYYYNCSTAQDIRANAFVLSEENYFKGCSNPQKVTVTDTYTGTVIKSYHDTLESCGTSRATVVTDRTASLSGNCYPDGSTNYTNFDTNASLFYYDSANKKSDVSLMNESADVPTTIPSYAGAGANAYKSILKDQNSSATKYTVTLMNGSTTFMTLKVTENNKAIEPTSYPTSTSGVFESWTLADGTAYDWNTLVTENITLYAKFSINPSYQALASSANKVLALDFNSTTSGTKLSQFSDYTTLGIFGGTNGTDYSIAYAKYTGNAVQTVDNDSAKAAMIYVSSGNTYTSGVVKGWVELSISQQSGSKWALLTFVGSNNQTVFTLGANSSSYLSYSVGSTAIADGTAFGTEKVAKGNTYKVYYEFDLDNGTTTIIINDTVYLNKALTNVKSFAGFNTMTNGSGTGTSARIITLDNIAIVKE